MNRYGMGWRALALAASVLLTWALPAWADPPGRVVRLGYATGEVSFLPGGANDWVDARVNRPLWAGDRVWTDNGARAELQTSNAALRVAPGTSVSIVAFDDRTAQYEVNEGTVRLRVRSLAPDETVEIDTPNLAFAVRSPGDYRIDVDPDTTTVAVYGGAAEAFGTQAAYAISAGMRIRFGGTDLSDYSTVPIARADPFDGWVRERVSYEERSVSARYVAPSVIGYEDLDRYGSWRVVGDYGNVWTPNNVAADWAPYRYGHWAWIDPWGWTWVDDAPWGFAPFHYGRWAFVDSRWCWVPGPRREQAVYAPALVGFVGGGGLSVSVTAGGGGIGWFPLGPGEIYRPAYQASREYFTRVNVTNTTVNVTQVTNVYNSPQTDVRYVNIARPNAVTAVPTQTFVQAQPVQRAMQKVDAQALQRAPIVAAPPQVAPARASIAGSTAPARAHPAANIVERPVIAKTPPPPAPPSIEQREQALKREPGKPLDQAELQKLAPAAAARPNVRVAQPAAAAKQLPPAASAAPEKGQPQQSARGKEEAPPAKAEPPQVGTAPAGGNEKGPTSARPVPAPSATAPPPPQARGRGTASSEEATTNGARTEPPQPPGRANAPVAKGPERPQAGAVVRAPAERPAPSQAAPAPVTRPESNPQTPNAQASQATEPRGRPPQAANVPPPRSVPQAPREAPQAANVPPPRSAPPAPRETPQAANVPPPQAAPQPPREAPQAGAPRGRPETAAAPREAGPRGRPETATAPPRPAPTPPPEQARGPETRPQPNAARRAPEPAPQRGTPESPSQQAAAQPPRPPEARPQPQQPRAAEPPPQRPAPGKGKGKEDNDKEDGKSDK